MCQLGNGKAPGHLFVAQPGPGRPRDKDGRRHKLDSSQSQADSQHQNYRNQPTNMGLEPWIIGQKQTIGQRGVDEVHRRLRMASQEAAGQSHACQYDLASGMPMVEGSIQEEQHQRQPHRSFQDCKLLDGKGGQVSSIGKGQGSDGTGKPGRRQPGSDATGQMPNEKVGEEAGQ